MIKIEFDEYIFEIYNPLEHYKSEIQNIIDDRVLDDEISMRLTTFTSILSKYGESHVFLGKKL